MNTAAIAALALEMLRLARGLIDALEKSELTSADISRLQAEREDLNARLEKLRPSV